MNNEFRQVVRLAMPGELRAYVVYEHQLDTLAQGRHVGLMLNFSLFFLGVAGTGFGTIAALPPNTDKTYYTFLIISSIAVSLGSVLFFLWLVIRRPVADLVAEIKSQMPANPIIEQIPADANIPPSTELHSSAE